MIRRPGWLRRRAAPRLRWAVVIAAPGGTAKEQWGDTWFARDLVAALRRCGQQAKVVTRGKAQSPERDADDVVLVLRGLHEVTPRRDGSGTTWMLWVISHPDLVQPQEAAAYDAVFAASAHWSRAAEMGAEPLLQATNPGRFTPGAAVADTGAELLFVGSTRGVLRPVIRDSIAGGYRPAVYGVGWDDLIDPTLIEAEFLANEALPAAYAAAHVVLNDHWPDMAVEGFLSNRLFDACATGTRVLSDPATGLAEVFGDTVRTYADASGLAAMLDDPDTAFPSRAERLDLAARIAREHSFDARAAVLIQRAMALRGRA